ncbi:hypothetical protein MP477_06175 [Chryseobacterium sp. WG23]|uniref:tetratricopeptide repeat protein n=1 Tax=Chryseobacterium sp. WG23 TaxID=2926910 RepID=UPI00211F231A|nr:tetratricopeptide repeat protein [Chryseobacterium sp. WG23]MCQ9634538.1 hypothetical protein [Chryseobacterium sp. WG23]
MNPRVLELIKNPKNIQSEDLHLLKEEIHAFPYIQNIRALHLYGVHLYDKESYQKELSITAAYTTDKKILYQLINGKIQQSSKPEITEEKQVSENAQKPVRYSFNKEKIFPIKREPSSEKEVEQEEGVSCMLQTSQGVEPIYVNGERNRILFEGEENFLDEVYTEKIDLESTLESGTLVTQKPVFQTVAKNIKEEEKEENVGENFTPETIITEDEISSEPEEEVQKEEEVSFHEVEAILPEVTVEEETVQEHEEGEENFTPETIITEDEISSEPEEEEVQKEEEVSFHEVEAIVPEVTVEEETVQEHEEEQENVEENNNAVSNNEGIADEPEAEISFHGTDSFMPDVKIQINEEEIKENTAISQPNVNKHEDEMRRLIEEVEKRMKEAKSASQEEKEEPEVVADHEISFAETQNFHFWSTEKEEEPAKDEEVLSASGEEKQETPEPVEESHIEEVTQEEKKTPEIRSAWKPMSLETNMPDSLLTKPAKVSEPEIEVFLQDETPEIPTEVEVKSENITAAVEESENIIEESAAEAVQIVEEVPELPENEAEHAQENAQKGAKEEAPVMNVSFFGTDISSLRVAEGKKEANEDSMKEETMQEVPVQKTVQPVVDSNVPGFINTWQSWLKIDRPEEAEKEKPEKKIKVIDNFIENNPKISQLKEESSYVVKEKNDDISHLMTETLANLYFEQKLYTKAIKAFEILIKKNPDKKEYFESKIKEIKDFRSKN